jgi:hypothetical protein
MPHLTALDSTIRGRDCRPSPLTRWRDAVDEIRWRRLAEPISWTLLVARVTTRERVRLRWRKACMIALRAVGRGFEDEATGIEAGIKATGIEATILDVQYWLEVLDVRHRYGCNLKIYQQVWARAGARQSFFFWLDWGEGRTIECVECSRAKLARERVRYLAREERTRYEVVVDGAGRLVWRRTGLPVDTTAKAWKDSVDGIVGAHEPAWPYVVDDDWLEAAHGLPAREESIEDGADADRVALTLHAVEPSRRVRRVSATTILNKMLRSSVRPNTWIFTADAQSRLFVGLKASGTFQHSTFTRGARICAAGTLVVRDGRLAQLSPLSGHYRPHTRTFRAFMAALRRDGVDMSRVAVAPSYCALLVLEAYLELRRGLHGLSLAPRPDETDETDEADKEVMV